MDTAQEPSTSVLREAHLRDYWKIIWQGRWTALAVFVVFLGCAAAWTFLQSPLYRATAVVEIQPQARRLMSSGDVSGLGAAGYGWFAEEKYHNTQIEILKSRDVASRVVRMLGLESHPRFAKSADVVNVFRKQIRVVPRRDTGLLEISISGPDPNEITQWVNALAQAYVTRNFEKAQENVEKAVQTIRAQMAAFSDELSDAEEVRIDALQDSRIFNSENQEEIVRQKLQTFTSELTTVNIERDQLSETLRQVRNMQAAGTDLMAIPELAADSSLQELQRSKVELERELESAKVDLRPGHPDFEKTRSELDKVLQRIGDRTALVVGGLQNRLDAVVRHDKYLREQIRNAEELSLQVAKATSRYDIIKTDADTKKQIFDLIAKTVNEVQLTAELMNNNVAILDDAVPPLNPIKPRKRLNLGIGAMFGMFLGLAVVFFLDYLDNTIRTPEDVEKYLGLSVLGVVPRMQEKGLAQRAIKEAYQSLRTSIIFSSKNRRRKIVLITSTGPREGKSSTAANLGRTLAAAGDRAVIIDCDLRRPKQHVHFDTEREPGLTNYLAAPDGDTDWAGYVKNLDSTTLQLLTSGPIPPSPPELLGNDRFAQLLESMRASYDWIIIDSPPAASLADASLLASKADMVVAVVQHNSTDRDHVRKTVQQLRAVNAEIAGVVLNNVDLDRAYHKDYYYAGYYYEEDKQPRSRKRRVERRAQVG